jgi:hypothetical protein
VIDQFRVEVDRNHLARSPHAIGEPAYDRACSCADLKATPAILHADPPEVVEREGVECALLLLKPSKLGLPAPLENVLSHSRPLTARSYLLLMVAICSSRRSCSGRGPPWNGSLPVSEKALQRRSSGAPD